MHKLEYIIVKTLFGIFRVISFNTGKFLALILYFIISKLIRYRKKVILENLKLVYGDQLPQDRKLLLNSIYKNFVFLWMEFLQISKLNKKFFDRHFKLHNFEIVKKAFEDQKGIIMMSGHFGNFEWLGQMHALLGYKVSGIAKIQSNLYVNELIEKIRTKFGVGVVYTKTAMRDGQELLKRNEILALVTDQDAHKKGIFVDFLGIPSSTAVGPAIFHFRTGAPIIFAISVRKDYGVFDVYFEEVCSASEIEEPDQERIKQITQLHTDALDKWIRKHPDQWFWMHRRWKTKQSTETEAKVK